MREVGQEREADKQEVDEDVSFYPRWRKVCRNEFSVSLIDEDDEGDICGGRYVSDPSDVGARGWEYKGVDFPLLFGIG